MNILLVLLAIVLVHTGSIAAQCSKNSDSAYSREATLESIKADLKKSYPNFESSAFPGFFIVDLANPKNRYDSSSKAEACIDFVEGHAYHFAPIEYEYSISHIAVARNGQMKVFRAINCRNSGDDLSDVLDFVSSVKALDRKRLAEQMTRLENYRRYGVYRTTDGYRLACNYDMPKLPSADVRYERETILRQFASVLREQVKGLPDADFPPFPVEESRANGFFVVDLTDLSNRQTSLLEAVNFRDAHVYHFGLIDGPFSYSNLAVLYGGKVKVFKNLTCSGKSAEADFREYLVTEKIPLPIRMDVLDKRIENIRDFGKYVPLEGKPEPLCISENPQTESSDAASLRRRWIQTFTHDSLGQ